MKNKYLDKVVDQIIREIITEIICIPWIKQWLRYDKSFRGKLNIPQPFTNHCKNIYGLNEDDNKIRWEKVTLLLPI